MMNLITQKALPDFIPWPDWRSEADDQITDMWNSHLEAAGPGPHACGYEPEGDGECEICDAHTDNCPRCQALLDADCGLECLDGNPPYWADRVDHARLIRTAREIVVGIALP